MTKEEKYQKNKEWIKNNPNYYKEWRLKNAQKKKDLDKKYRENNQEHIKQWRLDNKVKIRKAVEKLTYSIEPGVYMVKCLINNKRYIGQSTQPYNRRTHHFSNCTTAFPNTNDEMQIDLKQYGKDKFIFGIIEYCNKEELLIKEKQYINEYRPEYNS